MLVILVSLCLIVTGCVVAVSVHGLWPYVLGWLLFLISVAIVLHIAEWVLPRWDSLFEEG